MSIDDSDIYHFGNIHQNELLWSTKALKTNMIKHRVGAGNAAVDTEVVEIEKVLHTTRF